MQEKDKKQNSPIPPENIVEFIDVVNYQREVIKDFELLLNRKNPRGK